MVVKGAVTASAATMAAQQSPDDLVMGTNSSSIVSKRSVERLYYPDEPHFFRFFVPKFQRRSPLINRGYLLRLKAIDSIVRSFLEQPSSRKKVVVNLGCGSDVLPWQCDARWPELSREALFVDVDFPDLMEKKRRVVLATPELLRLLGSYELGDDTSPVLLSSARYCQVGCDLRQLALLKSTLSGLVGGATEAATFLFVAEVSITYLETRAADDVIRWASTLGDSTFCLLEQIMPNGPDNHFARTMLAHFDKLKTPLRSVFQYPTLASQHQRFLSREWQSVRAWTLWEAWADNFFMSPEERTRLDDVEPFDEWEELALFASHYLVLCASTQATSPVQGHRDGTLEDSTLPTYSSSVAFSENPSGRGQRRFGAAMLAENAQGQAFIAHLFGHGPRARLSSCDIHRFSDQLEVPAAQAGGPAARVCHALTDVGALGVLLTGGRASPSSPLRDCWLYQKVRNRWTKIQDLPVPLFRHSVIRLGSSSLVLVAGGKTDHRKVSEGFYVYHPEHGWLTCQAQGALPVLFGAALYLLSAGDPGSYEGLLVGGMLPSGTHNHPTFFWRLVITDARARITFSICETSRTEEQRLVSRFGATLLERGGKVLLLGGVTSGHQLPQDLDIVILRATPAGLELIGRVSWPHGAGTLPPFLIGASIVPLPDGQFSVLGGGATCFSMGTCWSPGTYTFSLPPPGALGACTPPNDARRVNFVQAIEVVPLQLLQKPLETSELRSLAPRAVRRIRLESREGFRELVESGQPAIIEGASIGPCISKWTPEYLVEAVGADRQVSVHEATSEKMDFNSKNFRYVTSGFQSFINTAQAHGKVYLRALSAAEPSGKATSLKADFPGLAADFHLPSELDWVENNIHSSVLRISGPVNMWLHYDVMANVYAQIQGSKRLILFHPRNVTELGFVPGASSSSIDVFAAMEAGSLGSAQPFEAEVGPGDILFLPPLWLHTAKPTARLSVAVNVFFRSLETGYAAGRDVYGNRDLAAYEKGQLDVQKIASSFDRLPRDMAEFYIRRLADELLRSAAR